MPVGDWKVWASVCVCVCCSDCCSGYFCHPGAAFTCTFSSVCPPPNTDGSLKTVVVEVTSFLPTDMVFKWGDRHGSEPSCLAFILSLGVLPLLWFCPVSEGAARPIFVPFEGFYPILIYNKDVSWGMFISSLWSVEVSRICLFSSFVIIEILWFFISLSQVIWCWQTVMKLIKWCRVSRESERKFRRMRKFKLSSSWISVMNVLSTGRKGLTERKGGERSVCGWRGRTKHVCPPQSAWWCDTAAVVYLCTSTRQPSANISPLS